MPVSTFFSKLSFSLSKLQLIGVLFFLFQLIWAIVFYKERATYMDVAFQTFEMITHNALQPQVFRFGSAFTQIFPFLGILAKAPLWIVALLYSVGVVVYNFLLFYYIAFVKKSTSFTLVFIFYSSMLLAHMFFWIQSEYSQALPLLIAFLCFIEHKEWTSMSVLSWLTIMAFIITLIFFHPLIFIAITICVYLFFLMSSNHFDKKIIISVWLFSLGTYIVKNIYFKNWYDAGAQDRTDNFISLFPHYFTTETTIVFFTKNLFNNAGLVISFIFLLVLLFSTKNFLKSILLVLPLVAYFFFINVTHPVAEIFYMENMYLALPLFIALILVFYCKEKQFLVVALSIALLVLFVVRLQLITSEHTKRLAYIRTLIDKYKNEKIILPESAVSMNILLFSWPIAYEIWMLSTIESGKTASIAIADNVATWPSDIPQRTTFYGIHLYPYKAMPARYFHFTDSLSVYRIEK